MDYLTFKEILGDLFTAPEEYYFAHCISSDFIMGAGIAPQFTKRFNTKYNLMELYPDFVNEFKDNDYKGYCIKDGRVFNLITKHRVWEKPTYESVEIALSLMKRQLENLNITKLAMPRIGCGIDGLNWDIVSNMIRDIFKDTNIDILIYYLD